MVNGWQDADHVARNNSSGESAKVKLETLAAAGILNGLDNDGRAERTELITWLLEQGFRLEEVLRESAPMLQPARRALDDDGGQVSARTVSEAHGIKLELLRRLERAMGLPIIDDPDAVLNLRADAEAAARQQQLIDVGLDADRVVLIVRRLAEGLSRAVPAIQYGAMSAVLHPGMTELEVAKAYEEIVGRLAPLLGPLICDVLFVQLRRAVDGEGLNAVERAAGTALPGTRLLAVAFADMVGFTRLGEVAPPEVLVLSVERLADLARDIEQPPVRMVKTIGDAVMLICPEPAKLMDAMLTLSDAAARDTGLPKLRIGIASGWAVSRARDWFGTPVNVASRITEIASSGTVLVAGSTRRIIGDADRFAWSYFGSTSLKGVAGATKLFEVRRAGAS